MYYLGCGVMFVLGAVSLAVAAEALWRGRIWQRSKHRPERDSRWVRRSAEPVNFWVHVSLFAGLGLGMIGCGVYAALYPSR